MGKNNATGLDHVENTLVQQTATTKCPLKKQYRKPQCTLLGDLDTIQAHAAGKQYDGPDRSFYYNP